MDGITIGYTLGTFDGIYDGLADWDGFEEKKIDGVKEGRWLCICDGTLVGRALGFVLGISDGSTEGAYGGLVEGYGLGSFDGVFVNLKSWRWCVGLLAESISLKGNMLSILKASKKDNVVFEAINNVGWKDGARLGTKLGTDVGTNVFDGIELGAQLGNSVGV